MVASGSRVSQRSLAIFHKISGILGQSPNNFPRAIAHASNKSELRNSDGSDTIYGFQCDERYLEWDDSAARQLIKIYVAEKLDTDLDYVNLKMKELAAVCPDMVNKLDKLKANLVLALVRDTEKVAERMIALTSVLPGSNVSKMVSSNIWLLRQPSPEILANKLENLRKKLPNVNLERLIEAEPRLLLADIDEVLSELQRLLPGADPVKLVATHAGMVLPMKYAGMESSLSIDDGIQAD
ncbi:hypothetical protein Ndes2526B_g04552 [Nannochloris sp. 'desiccata']